MNRTGAQFNRVSGRIETGSAVTAKVFTLGNSFELSGRDYYEKDSKHVQSIKENRLRQGDQKRRLANTRARVEKERVSQAHKAHLVSSTRPDRFGGRGSSSTGRGPPPRKRVAAQSSRHPRRVPSNKPPRSPLRSPDRRSSSRDHGGNGDDDSDFTQAAAAMAAAYGGSKNNEEIGVVVGRKENQHYDTRRALDERHQSSVSRAKGMQRGSDGSGGKDPEDKGSWYLGRNAHKDTMPRSRGQQRSSSDHHQKAAAYTAKKNTRKSDEYLNILLGKSPTREQEGEAEEDEGKRGGGRSPPPRGSPGSVQKARALEKELNRRRRLMEMEMDLVNAEVGLQQNDESDEQQQQQRGTNGGRRRAPVKSSGYGASAASSAPFANAEPLARRMERRKLKEKRKMEDGNVTRLIRAVKSVVVELQLNVWDWAKKPEFKSKDVARSRRVGLRRKLHRLLEDHRRSVIELVSALRQWITKRTSEREQEEEVSSEEQVNTFEWHENDVMELLRTMPEIIGSSSDGARGLHVPGTSEAHASEFGLSFLTEIDQVVDFLGFAVGEGDVVTRIDGALDCNAMLLIPEDRVRALRLLGEDREADHMAASVLLSGRLGGRLMGGGVDGEEPEEEEEEDVFPYSCPEDMPLACRLCHAGERSEDGKCANCGHMGGDGWRELDEEARVLRYEEEKEWFVEDQEEKRIQKAAKKERKGKKGDVKRPCDIKYQPKITDKDLLKIAKVHRSLLLHHLEVQDAEGTRRQQQEGEYESKMEREEEDDGYGENSENDEEEEEMYENKIGEEEEVGGGGGDGDLE